MATGTEDNKRNGLHRVDDSRGMFEAIRQAGREAVWWHKLAGNPVTTWQDGKVRWVQPDEIKGPPPGAPDLHGPSQ